MTRTLNLRTSKGFTLIEIAVVMLIAAIIATMFGVRMAAGAQKKLNEEVRRVDALIELASQQALLQNKDIGISITENGYQFFRFEPQLQSWQSLAGERTFRDRQLPESINMQLSIEDSAVNWPEAEEDDADESDSDSEDEEETIPTPQILMLSTGEITPFDLYFEMNGVEQGVQLRVTVEGEHEIIQHEFGF